MTKILIFPLIIALCSAQNSPVFLWGSTTSSILRPALKPINKLDFIDFLEPEIGSSMFLVFLETDLETQDLTLCKRSNGKTCFTNLSSYKSKSFLSDVENPVQALNTISQKHEIVVVNENGKLDDDIEFENGKIVFVKFEKEEDERSVILKEHDSIIGNIYNKLATKGNVIGIYTSGENKVAKHRVRRQTNDAIPRKAQGAKYVADGVLMYWTDVKVRNGDKTETITISGIEKSNPKNKSFDIKFTGTDLVFTVLSRDGYWILNGTTFKTEPVRGSTYALEDFSYYCGKQVFQTAFRNQSITFYDFQMQVEFNGTEIKKFGDAYHCDGFMSIAIWMGLFVGFIYLIILYFAITWIMDINANDRFEDPKGKTIVVAQES